MKFISALLFSGFVAMASAQTIEPSGISFKVSGSSGFPILDTGAGSILDYDLSADRIDFNVGATGSYDNPFFCFDFSEPTSTAVTLNATDANGHVVMDAVGLASDLTYNLVDTISFSPSSSVQCFYESTQTIDGEQVEVFGPYGEEADNISRGTTSTNSLFSDSFAAFPKLDIVYQEFAVYIDGVWQPLDGGVSAGSDISYEIVVRNNGNATADQLAFQEVFPASTAYVASLTDGTWACQDNTELDDLCSAAGLTEGTGPLRIENLELPPGGEVTFTVFRTVQVDSLTGQILFHSGAVDGPGKLAKNAVAQAILDVL